MNKLPYLTLLNCSLSLYSVLILDEVDNLFALDQNILYRLFEYSALPGGRFTLVAIANEINLRERLLPRLNANNGKMNFVSSIVVRLSRLLSSNPRASS